MTVLFMPEGSTTAELVEHLVACHPGADMPWFTRSGFIERMTLEQLERLHGTLHDQGENHETMTVPIVEARPAVCRKYRCAEQAMRADGLCARHGVAQDRLRGRRSA